MQNNSGKKKKPKTTTSEGTGSVYTNTEHPERLGAAFAVHQETTEQLVSLSYGRLLALLRSVQKSAKSYGKSRED